MWAYIHHTIYNASISGDGAFRILGKGGKGPNYYQLMIAIHNLQWLLWLLFIANCWLKKR